LPAQTASAVTRPADYVTILIGANDACRGAMTSLSAFRGAVDDALATLRQGLPKARLLLVSIPNVYRVWEIGHKNSVATKVWKSGICPNLLTNATSTAAVDAERRAAFRDRIAAYNGQLRQACAAYGSKCRFDDVSRFAFDLDMLSAIDFFHPNAAGQEALAGETYPKSFTW
jgi:lysophospholipase L1-like esterase